MNALETGDGGAHLLPLAGHPVRRRRDCPSTSTTCMCAVQGGRLRPGDRGDAGHRPGRRGHRAVLRRRAVRHDAGVRRRLAAGEDRHARLRRRRGDQQVRAPRRRGRPPRRRPPAGAQPRGLRASRGSRCRSSAPAPPGSTTTASPRCTSTCSACSSDKGLPVGAGVLPRVDVRASTGLTSVVPRDPRPVPRRDRRRRPRAPPRPPRSRPGSSAGAAALRTTARAARRRRRRPDASGSCSRPPTGELLPEVRDAAGAVARAGRGVLRRRAGLPRCADKEIRTPLTRETLSGTKVRRVALPRTQDDGELLRFLRRENLPGVFPFTAGVFPFKRAGRGAGADVRRRGRRLPHQPPLPAAVGRQRRRPGCRRRSTRSPSTAATPTRGPTSTARSARPGSRSRRSRT